MQTRKITICLDFDISISFFHLHNECYKIYRAALANPEENQKYSIQGSDYIWEKLKEKNLLATAGAGWKELIEQYLSQPDDYNVVIVTRSSFPKIVSKFIHEFMRIEKPIPIIYGGLNAPDKTGHMNCALTYFDKPEKLTIDSDGTISVDLNPKIANENFDDDKPLAGAIIADDSYDGFEWIEKLGARTIKLEPEHNNQNSDIATEKLPIEIENAKKEIVKAEVLKVRRLQLKADRDRIGWFADKLALISRLLDTISTTETFSPLNSISQDADNDVNILFKEFVIELEKVFQKLIDQSSFHPDLWGKTPVVPVMITRNLNAHQDQNHLMRMIALLLKDIYIKYPDVKNEKIARSIENVKNIPGGYKEGSQFLVNYVTPISSKEIEVEVKPSTRPPFRSR